MMKKEIVITGDGSHTIAVPGMNVMYHSKYGAVQESMHVFIDAGLKSARFEKADRLRIFEMGLGTGLNAFLTCIEAGKLQIRIHYTAIEQYPISCEDANALNYPDILGKRELLNAIHEDSWNKDLNITEYFTLNKIQASLDNLSPSQLFNLVYYDAFAPSVQPELWTKEVFEKLHAMMEEDGVLVTYSSKGDVRRALMTAGFTVEKLPGPKGKREMIRAKK